MRTVCSSTTSTDLIQVKLPRIGDFCSGFSTRSNENFTLSAPNGSPLWNLTPLRSLSSQVSGLTPFTDSARWGTGCHVLVSRASRGSKRCWCMMMPMRSVCMCGSCVEASEASATVTRPLGAASAAGAAATSEARMKAPPARRSVRAIYMGSSSGRAPRSGRAELVERGGGGPDAVDEAFDRDGLVGRVVGLVVGRVGHPHARQGQLLRGQGVGDGG